MNKASNSLKDWFVGNRGNLPRILVLDGGVSTHLEDVILGQRKSSKSEEKAFPYRELWSSGLLLNEKGKQQILQGHIDWLNAGANVITTVTYQCHYEEQFWPSTKQQSTSSSSSSEDQNNIIITKSIMDKMWKDGIHLAQEALSKFDEIRPVFCLASSGCYGAILANGAEYTGDYSNIGNNQVVEVVEQFHKCKIKAAIVEKPHAIAFETVPSFNECIVLRNLLLSNDIQSLLNKNSIGCYISLSCHNGNELNDGTPLQQALEVFHSIPISHLQGIGLNCCNAHYLKELLTILIQDNGPKRGIIIYPNSGEVWDATNETWLPGTGLREKADEMAIYMMDVIKHIEKTWPSHDSLPSILVGGCCRTQPSTIASLRRLVDLHLDKKE